MSNLGDTIFTAQQYNKYNKELAECHCSINKLAATAFITGFVIGAMVVTLVCGYLTQM